MQNEKGQLGHLEASLKKERARQAAARKRAEEAERLKADELSAVVERQMQMQAKLAEAAAENDARDARKALEDAMQLEMDMAETEVSSTSVEPVASSQASFHRSLWAPVESDILIALTRYSCAESLQRGAWRAPEHTRHRLLE